MMESQRIDRSLDGAGALARRAERGFTLVELMVTIGILAVLLALAIGGWRQLEQANRVEGAIEEIRSAMSAARIKAQTSGRDQSVGVDFDNDRFISTVFGGTYDGASWTGNWRTEKGVDLLAGTQNCTASTATGIKTFTFTPKGTVSVTGGGPSKTVMARDMAGGRKRCLVVNTITGRARLAQ